MLQTLTRRLTGAKKPQNIEEFLAAALSHGTEDEEE